MMRVSSRKWPTVKYYEMRQAYVARKENGISVSEITHNRQWCARRVASSGTSALTEYFSAVTAIAGLRNGISLPLLPFNFDPEKRNSGKKSFSNLYDY
ncbi:hypothetical protein ACUTJJ_04235 [Agrobacterium sp. DKPNP3]|uniref:hypothetical protein n=1 Tax=Agrobacterium sp. DKPNP3 TaxID=3457323 RepID=UPI004044CC06